MPSKQAELGMTTAARRAVADIPPPPPGYVKPARWDQLWGHPPERVLLATHRGWEPVDRYETRMGTRLVEQLDECGNQVLDSSGLARKIYIDWEYVTPGVLWFHGTRLTELKLTSVRIPAKGERQGLSHG